MRPGVMRHADKKLPAYSQESDPGAAAASQHGPFPSYGSGTGALGCISTVPPLPPALKPQPSLARSASNSSHGSHHAATVRSMLKGGDTPPPLPAAAPLLRWSSSVLGSDVLLSEVQILQAMYPEQIKGLHMTHAPPLHPGATPAHDDDVHPGQPAVTDLAKGTSPLKPLPARLSTGQAVSVGLWRPVTAAFASDTPEAIAEARCMLLRVELGSSGFDTLPVSLQALLWKCGGVDPLRLTRTSKGQASAIEGITAFQSVDVLQLHPPFTTATMNTVDSFRLRLIADIGGSSGSQHKGMLRSGGDVDTADLPLQRREAAMEATLQAKLPTTKAAQHFLWAALRLALEMQPAPKQEQDASQHTGTEQLVRVAFPEGYPLQAPAVVTRLHQAAWSAAGVAAGINLECDPPLQPFALPESHEQELQQAVDDAIARNSDSGAGVMFDALQALQEHSLGVAATAEHSDVRLRFSRTVGRAGTAAWSRFLNASAGAGGIWSDPLATLIAILPEATNATAAAAASAGAGAAGSADAGTGQLDYSWVLLIRDMVAVFMVRQGCLLRSTLLLVALRALLTRALSQLPEHQRDEPVVGVCSFFLQEFGSIRAVFSSLFHKPVVLGETAEDLARSAQHSAAAQRSSSAPDLWMHFGLQWSKLGADTLLGPRSSLLRQLSGRYGILEMHDVFRAELAVQFLELWQRFQMRYGMRDVRSQVSVGYCLLREGVSMSAVASDGLRHELEMQSTYPELASVMQSYKDYGLGPGNELEYQRGVYSAHFHTGKRGHSSVQSSRVFERNDVVSLVNTPSAAERLQHSRPDVQNWHDPNGTVQPNFRIVVCAVLRGATQGREKDMELCTAATPPQAWADDLESPQAQQFQRMRTEMLARASVRQSTVVQGIGASAGVYDSDTEAWGLGPPPYTHLASPGAEEAGGAPWQRWHLFDTAQVLPCFALHLVPLRKVVDTTVDITHVHIVTGGGSLAKAPRHTLTALQQQAIDRAANDGKNLDDEYDARLKNAAFFVGTRFPGNVQVCPLGDSDDDEFGTHGMRNMPILTPEQATKLVADQADQMVFRAMSLPSAKRRDVAGEYLRAQRAMQPKLQSQRRAAQQRPSSAAQPSLLAKMGTEEHNATKGNARAQTPPLTPRLPTPYQAVAEPTAVESHTRNAVFRSLAGVVGGEPVPPRSGRGRGGVTATVATTGAQSRLQAYMQARRNTDYAVQGFGSAELEQRLGAQEAARRQQAARSKQDVLREARQLQEEADAIKLAGGAGAWGPQIHRR